MAGAAAPVAHSPGPARSSISVLALGALALPALGLTLHSDSAVSLPDSIAMKHSLERLTAAFPNQNATQRVVVKATAAEGPLVVDGAGQPGS